MNTYKESAAPAPMLETSLETLMSRYQQGDAGATMALIDRVSPLLLRFFRAQYSTREHAEDLLQDAWLRIHKARHTHRPGEPALPWLYAIARHVRIDGYRKHQRIGSFEKQFEQLPEPAQQSAAPAHSGPDLEALLAALPAGQREVITLLKVSGLSLEEVALATSSSVGAVKQKAHRAYEKLRLILGAAR